MPFFDLPLEQLESYFPSRYEAGDFDNFWQITLQEARQYPLNAQFQQVDYGLKSQEVYDVVYSGYGGQSIRAWLLLPRHRSNPVPCVIEYVGYTEGRGLPIDWLIWSSAGYAHFIMDNRGQGSGSVMQGVTPDSEAGSGPTVPGFMTQGILDPHLYFYRRIFTDAVRAVEAARNYPSVDAQHIAITGCSQGGGITLAVAGLVSDINIVMPDVPFLCHYRRATELVDTMPYNEIVRFCNTHRDKEDVIFNTLSYFDGINFAFRSKARALFSVGLMDMICPPSTVFAAYNYYAGQKDMCVYTYNQHEGGGNFHTIKKMELVREMWG